MRPNLLTILFGVGTTILAGTNALLVIVVLLNNDKVEVMHDQLIAVEAKLESRTADYNNLLERIGGADVPKVPYTPKRPGSLGDK